MPSSATSVSLLLAGCRQLRAQHPTGTLFPAFPAWARLLLPSPEGGERPVKRAARSASLTCCWLAAGPASPACRVCVAPGYRPLPSSLRSTRKLKRRCSALVVLSRGAEISLSVVQVPLAVAERASCRRGTGPSSSTDTPRGARLSIRSYVDKGLGTG